MRKWLHPVLRGLILSEYGGICQYCGRSGASDVDHIVPLRRGGADAVCNFTLACRPCNVRKASLILDDEILRPVLARSAAAAPSIVAAYDRARHKDPTAPHTRKTIAFPVSLAAEVSIFRHRHHFRTEGEALEHLILAGINAEAMEAGGGAGPAGA